LFRKKSNQKGELMEYQKGQKVKFKVVWFNDDKSVKKVSHIIEQGKIYSKEGKLYNIVVMDDHNKTFTDTGFGFYFAREEDIIQVLENDE